MSGASHYSSHGQVGDACQPRDGFSASRFSRLATSEPFPAGEVRLIACWNPEVRCSYMWSTDDSRRTAASNI